MRLLADTQIFLWSVNEPRRLPRRIAAALEAPGAEVWLSVVSVWEARLKADIGKLVLDDDLSEIMRAFLAGGARVLSFEAPHALLTLPDPPPTRDPFDRMLLAQCDIEDMRLLTADKMLKGHRLAWSG